MKIEKVAMADLKPLEKNVRKHSATQLRELQRSFMQFGQTRPLVIDEENNILVGNGFFEALKIAGEESVECYRIPGLSEIQKKKLVLSDNKTFSLGLDYYDGIMEYVSEITSSGDLDIAGYDEQTLKEMTASIDDILESVRKQGIISEKTAIAMNAGFEQHEAMPYPPPSSCSQPGKVQDEVPLHDVAAKPVVDRTVVCPNCGEVIRLG